MRPVLGQYDASRRPDDRVSHECHSAHCVILQETHSRERAMVRNVNVSESHTRNVNVSEPHTRNVNVS